ncbi:hypothetical protein MON38_02655 [Hymenobacter sp. DH14]|uniref:Uncharacterized protein n=1 Tax=Hymenobacter cyanobacteriorum TaxID=2926463 RepID=A0A9X1VBY7_9BACT|nr:hypothetical protein [Hymenobacter cyanobacteriorum]MCI1186304.1 hypothetical protein [Hymenobacter cyanobacteriorum]
MKMVEMKVEKFIAMLLLACGLFAFRSDEIEFDTKTLFGNQIELKIPKGFIIMPEEMAKLKFIPERRPTLVYTNETGNISVALNITNSKATQAELPAIKEDVLRAYKHPYVSAREKWNAIQMVNGRKVGFIEFGTLDIKNTVYGTSATERSAYNLIFFTDFHGRLLLCNVSCIDKNSEQWQYAAKEIMASLKLK